MLYNISECDITYHICYYITRYIGTMLYTMLFSRFTRFLGSYKPCYIAIIGVLYSTFLAIYHVI